MSVPTQIQFGTEGGNGTDVLIHFPHRKDSGAIWKFEKDMLIIIRSKGKGRSPNVYALPKLINIAEGKEVF